MKKMLTVYRAGLRRDRYNEHLNEWEEYVVKEGALYVRRADGTRMVYAPGQWLGINTEYVEAP